MSGDGVEPFLLLEDIKSLWEKIMRERGHEPYMDKWSNGTETLDIFVDSEGIHNGPGCTKCDWSCCMHCEDDPYKAIPLKCNAQV